jgi:hypothetical protein
MPEVLNREVVGAPSEFRALPSSIDVDERAARRSMRAQIVRLESDLAATVWSASPGQRLEAPRLGGGRPRVLSLRDLERVRDQLADAAASRRQALSERALVEERNRLHVEAMLLDPAAHQWDRVCNRDVGEPGCKQWHVRPRWGVLGMLMSWWRVKISSGCPLAMGRDLVAARTL